MVVYGEYAIDVRINVLPAESEDVKSYVTRLREIYVPR